MKPKYWILGLAAIGLVWISGFSFQVLPSLLQIQPAQAQLLTSRQPRERNSQPGNLIPVSFNQEFRLKLHKTAVLEAENLQVKLVNITQDSRCPIGVSCIWQGQVLVVVNISQDDQNLGDFVLTSRVGSPDLAVKDFGENSTIKVIDVQPERSTDSEVKKSDYIVTLMLSKA